MGYEMKFYIGLKIKEFKGVDNSNYDYFQKIAMFDYCCDNEVADFFDKNGVDSKVYGFFTQEDIEEIKDKYGKEFKTVPISDLIRFLKKDYKGTDYRRYKPFLAMLKGFEATKEKFETEDFELMIIRYGY